MTLPAHLPHVVGADISLTATGFAWPDKTTQTHGRTRLTAAAVPLAERAETLTILADELDTITRSRCTLWDHRAPVLIGAEGLPPTGSGGFSERCYLWWRFVHLVSSYGTPVLVVPPKTVKLYATGHGDSPKRDVIQAARDQLPGWEVGRTSKTGKVLTTFDDNKSDAVWIMAITCHVIGYPLVSETPFRARALEKLILPEGVQRS